MLGVSSYQDLPFNFIYSSKPRHALSMTHDAVYSD